jgi:2-polyprenyl-3-methyl-5-hydroxy-6-metoxy-1,4-benzoquinol methylase
MMESRAFWEVRARQYAAEGQGLRAVCSYAMPRFYNAAIDLTQRRALRGIIASVGKGSNVLDFGCGVGRWSRELARRGARVTGVDFSATMLTEAKRRTEVSGLGDCCRFIQADVTELKLDRAFDLILGVTVLQHVLSDDQLARTIALLARHLRPGGRLVLVEAAPNRLHRRAETSTFRVRTSASYLAAARSAGLRVVSVCGVDPAPFKLWVVPRFREWPRWLALPALALATACALPIDLLLARPLTRLSWHKIIVARATEGTL